MSLNSLNPANKICAVIPFYNEKDFLADVLSQTLKFVDKVIAVNDGSNDNSENIAAKFDNVQLIDLKKNCGKGFALQTGFDEAVKQNFNVIVTLDADNQHKPDLILDLVKQLKNYDVVIGNRLNDKTKMPIQRILSNTITSFLLTIKTGQNIIDSQCGFRAYNYTVLKNIKTTYSGYEAESEIIIKSAKAGFKIGFVPIPTIYGNETSKMNPVKAILGFIKVLFI